YAVCQLHFIIIFSDYLRAVTAFVAFYYMPTNPWAAAFWYLFSGLLDAIDGHLARMLNQGSRVGAMLDMLIDRCTTMCLLAALCHFYPSYMMFFQFSMALDITSHWIHVQSSMMKGSDSHKKIDLSAHPVLRHYYHNRIILFVMCSANELFYCMLYMVYFSSGPQILGIGIFKLILWLSAPLSIIKSLISVLQLATALQNVAAVDIQERAETNKQN
ncbi:hypothetical protein FSP39_024736, partial [Pinctada imbricata]